MLRAKLKTKLDARIPITRGESGDEMEAGMESRNSLSPKIPNGGGSGDKSEGRICEIQSSMLANISRSRFPYTMWMGWREAHLEINDSLYLIH